METIKSIPQIVAFVKVSEMKSFSKAAERLRVSKSYLSKLVSYLETSLKVELLSRTTRSVELTDIGEHFFSQYKEHVFELEKLTTDFSELCNLPKGTFRLTLAGAFGEDVVTPIVARIVARHPTVSMELIFSETVLDLEKENIDLAIRVCPKKPKDGVAEKIGERFESVCASRGFIKKNGIPNKPTDLKKMNCIIGSKSKWVFKGVKYSQSVDVAGNFRCSNGRGLCKAALSGLGFVKLPRVYLREHIESGELIEVLKEYTNKPVPIWAIRPRKKLASKATQIVITELKEQLRASGTFWLGAPLDLRK